MELRFAGEYYWGKSQSARNRHGHDQIYPDF